MVEAAFSSHANIVGERSQESILQGNVAEAAFSLCAKIFWGKIPVVSILYCTVVEVASSSNVRWSVRKVPRVCVFCSVLWLRCLFLTSQEPVYSVVEVAFPDMRGLLIYYGGKVPGVCSVVYRGGGGFSSHAKIIRDSRIL